MSYITEHTFKKYLLFGKNQPLTLTKPCFLDRSNFAEQLNGGTFEIANSPGTK